MKCRLPHRQRAPGLFPAHPATGRRERISGGRVKAAGRMRETGTFRPAPRMNSSLPAPEDHARDPSWILPSPPATPKSPGGVAGVPQGEQVRNRRGNNEEERQRQERRDESPPARAVALQEGGLRFHGVHGKQNGSNLRRMPWQSARSAVKAPVSGTTSPTPTTGP